MREGQALEGRAPPVALVSAARRGQRGGTKIELSCRAHVTGACREGPAARALQLCGKKGREHFRRGSIRPAVPLALAPKVPHSQQLCPYKHAQPACLPACLPAKQSSVQNSGGRSAHNSNKQWHQQRSPAMLLPPLGVGQVGPVLSSPLFAHPASDACPAAAAGPAACRRCLCATGQGAALARGSKPVDVGIAGATPASAAWTAGGRTTDEWPPGCKGGGGSGAQQSRLLPGAVKPASARNGVARPPSRLPPQSPGTMQGPRARPAPAPASSPGHWRVSAPWLAGSGLHVGHRRPPLTPGAPLCLQFCGPWPRCSRLARKS